VLNIPADLSPASPPRAISWGTQRTTQPVRLPAAFVLAVLITFPTAAGAQSKLITPSQTPPVPAPLQVPPPSFGEDENRIPKTVPAPKHQESENERRGTADAPLIVEMHNTTKTDAEATAERARKEAADRWIIVLTAALVFATMLQFGALGYQGYWLRRTVLAAERTLIELERPWLFVEGATVTRHDPSNILNSWDISIRWKNFGRTPALIESCVFRILDKDKLPDTPDYTQASPLDCQSTVGPNEAFDTRQVGPGPRQTALLVFFGRVEYKELGGRLHHTSFALEVSPNIAAFSRHNNDAYHRFD
jgi:hypothetical protein